MTDLLRGPDVSTFQGEAIDWRAVKAAGASFAFCKATEGTGLVDSTFRRNWSAIKDAGLLRGAYAVRRPDLGPTPEAAARFFLGTVEALAPGDVLILDLDLGNGNLSPWAL